MNITISNLLQKLSAINNQSNLSQLDRDKMMDYTKNLYDVLLEMNNQESNLMTNIQSKAEETPVVQTEIKSETTRPTEPIVNSTPEIDREMDEILTVADRTRQEPIQEKPISTQAPIFSTPTPVEPRDNTRVEMNGYHPKVETPPIDYSTEVKETNQELSELFQPKTNSEIKDLSEKLANGPIKDIENSMSLNDKLLYSKVLFKNDEEFRSTLQALQNSYSMSQAKSFLRNIAESNDWTTENKQKIAQNFINLVARRFL